VLIGQTESISYTMKLLNILDHQMEQMLAKLLSLIIASKMKKDAWNNIE